MFASRAFFVREQKSSGLKGGWWWYGVKWSNTLKWCFARQRNATSPCFFCLPWVGGAFLTTVAQVLRLRPHFTELRRDSSGVQLSSHSQFSCALRRQGVVAALRRIRLQRGVVSIARLDGLTDGQTDLKAQCQCEKHSASLHFPPSTGRKVRFSL